MEKEKGYVYILTNKAFRENWVKIGRSSRPVNVRSKELDNTAVPLPFDIYATMCTSKYVEAENLVHSFLTQFTDRRIRANREFFNVSPKEALDIFYKVKGVIDDAEIDEVYRRREGCSLCGGNKQKREQAKKEQGKLERHLFFCTRAGSNAQGYFKEETEEFVVLAGSELRSGECDSLKPQSIEKRNAFIAANCTQTKGKIVLKSDYTFPSPSAAAAMVVGGSSNGWTRWKDANDKTLSEVYRKK